MKSLYDNGYIDARILHKEIGKKSRFTDWIDRKISYLGLVDGVDFFTSKISPISKKGGRPLMCISLTKKAASLISLIEGNEKSINIYKCLEGINDDSILVVKPTRKEILFGWSVYGVFGGLTKVIEQYNINGFKIDFFMPEFNLAIEYDELDSHKYKSKNDEERQLEIEELLSCSFIRIKEGEEMEGIKSIISFIIDKTKTINEFNSLIKENPFRNNETNLFQQKQSELNVKQLAQIEQLTRE